MHVNPLRISTLPLICVLLIGTKPATAFEPPGKSNTSRDTLTSEQWNSLDLAVNRGLKYLATQQRSDGSFATIPMGQPGITSLCVMAFLSRGHVPFGQQISRAIDFVLATQQENGILFDLKIDPYFDGDTPTHCAIYNHAISGLMLTEVYGMTDGAQGDRIAKAIRKALTFSLRYEEGFRKRPLDKGGFRYVRQLKKSSDSDLSITAWQLMFFRSARNAQFDVPAERVEAAMAYIKRCFDPRSRRFRYGLYGENPNRPPSRGMQGAAIVSLSMGGEHQSEMAQAAGNWLLSHSFDRYNRSPSRKDRYHYGAFYCSQAMFQLGGEYWTKFFPGLMRTLARNQKQNGSWDRESQDGDGRFGHCYTTALALLALTPPYQLLPIYQR
jgi:hypothetical protein